MKISIKKLLFITISLFIINNLYSGTYDGYYNAQFAFKMSQKSYCPNELPVDIEIEVRDNKVIGYIFNQGHPNNSNRNCALYHNGDITGEIDDNGKIIKLRINQKSGHAKRHASYKITGTLDGECTLLSRSPQYHPPFKFKWTKSED